MTTSNHPITNEENAKENEANAGLSNTQVGGTDALQEGLTPVHRQNINEARIDELLVEEALDDKHYPTIGDIADDEAAEHSNNNND